MFMYIVEAIEGLEEKEGEYENVRELEQFKPSLWAIHIVQNTSLTGDRIAEPMAQRQTFQ